MDKIYEQYVKSALNLNEGVSSFRYKYPKDKEQQLFDFYTLVSLPTWGLSGSDIRAASRESEELIAAAQEAQEIVVKNLKKQQLNDVLFSIAAEFRHIFANNSPEEIADYAKKKGVLKELQKYTMLFKLRNTGSKELIPRLEKIRSEYDANSRRSYLDSYKAIKGAFKGKEKKLVEFARDAFIDLRWSTSYGSTPWSNIAKAWLKLYSANTYEDNVVWIDHVFDLQHNTDTVFNKIKDYSKLGSFSWLKNALDKKRNAKSLFEFWNDVSGPLKYFSARLIKAATGETYESWSKGININKGNLTSTTSNRDLFKTSQSSNNSSYTLIDGLTEEKLKRKYPWILEADISKAIIGEKNGKLFWKAGIWNDGVWDNGRWEDGVWHAGTWKGGVWQNGTWKAGTWEGGTWKDGIWRSGTWKDGTWITGLWKNGIWENGIWEYGTWKDGTWKDGKWKNGFWENGSWQNGTWEYGTWFDGIWQNGTWEGGTWYDGTWRSGIWKKGTWEDGTWEGGTWVKGIKK